MAEDAVDHAHRRRRAAPVSCRSSVLSTGAAPGAATGWCAATAPRRATSRRSPGDDPRLLEPVAPGVPVLGVELAWGVHAEGALTVEDLLERRTRLSLVDAWHEAARAAADAALGAAV